MSTFSFPISNIFLHQTDLRICHSTLLPGDSRHAAHSKMIQRILLAARSSFPRDANECSEHSSNAQLHKSKTTFSVGCTNGEANHTLPLSLSALRYKCRMMTGCIKHSTHCLPVREACSFSRISSESSTEFTMWLSVFTSQRMVNTPGSLTTCGKKHHN